MGDVRAVNPFDGPVDADVRPPGSKSITNRALVCAGLAGGTSRLSGVLVADDTEAMLGCLADLGIVVRFDRSSRTAEIVGCRGRPPVPGALLDARQSGTTARFIAPVAALGHADVVVDGDDQLRRRPMSDILDALAGLGAVVTPMGEEGHLPFRLTANGLRGGTIGVAGDLSSQFLSGLLLAAPCMDDELRIDVTTPLVSRPYVDMTIDVMARFGAHTRIENAGSSIVVAPSGYRATSLAIEPDASAASYFFAAAAITGGRVRVDGLGASSTQGDLAFVDVLEQMGAQVRRNEDWTEVRGTGRLEGVTVDLSELSDTAQTLAAVAAFASGPTVVTGIGFIRRKETDRIAAVVTELRRLGIEATEDPDGFTIIPGPIEPGVVHTYDDHRMAMSFALIGLRTDGIGIADPDCVAKTYPEYWADLESIRPGTG